MAKTIAPPALDRVAVAAEIANVDADRIALEARLRDLRIAAAHARLRGKHDPNALAAARAELAHLDDVRAGLVAVDIILEMGELSAAIEEQNSIIADADTRLRDLLPRANAAWSGGFDVGRTEQNRERGDLERQIHYETWRARAARDRVAELQKRQAGFEQAHSDLVDVANSATQKGRI